ncbi:MAG: AAA family ATPase [Patescibacteria group bacterium]|mgnify:CR=1 FL=1
MEKNKIKLGWPLVGNEHIIEFLVKSIVNNKCAGSYVFVGPDNLGKTTLANFFAQSLVCLDLDRQAVPCGKCKPCQQAVKGIHSDIHLINRDKDKKNISIEQIRDFIRTLSLSSFLNSYKIGIIKHAEDLSLEAVNALLKTLEEPKVKVVIILITSYLESLPATIISRSQILKFHTLPTDVIYNYLIKYHQAQRSVAKNFSRLCLGRPALAIKFIEDKDFYESYKKKVETFLSFTDIDINKRLIMIEELIGKEAKGQESARLAARAIEVWQGLVRDLLFLFFEQDDLIQHHIFAEKLKLMKNNFDIHGLLKLSDLLKQIKKFIKANVSPKLALEQIAINI